MNIEQMRQIVYETILEETKKYRESLVFPVLSEKGQRLQAILDEEVFGCNNVPVARVLSELIGEKLSGESFSKEKPLVIYKCAENGTCVATKRWHYSEDVKGEAKELFSEKEEAAAVKTFVNGLNVPTMNVFFGYITARVVEQAIDGEDE